MKQLRLLVIILAFGFTIVGCEEDKPPRDVTGVVATLIEGSSSWNDSVHITWDRISGDSTRYEIAYRTAMDSPDTRTPISSNLTNTTYTHTGYVRNRGNLTYYVRASGLSGTNSDGTTNRWTGSWGVSNSVWVRE